MEYVNWKKVLDSVGVYSPLLFSYKTEMQLVSQEIKFSQ